jgi:hypothetical protein
MQKLHIWHKSIHQKFSSTLHLFPSLYTSSLPPCPTKHKLNDFARAYEVATFKVYEACFIETW